MPDQALVHMMVRNFPGRKSPMKTLTHLVCAFCGQKLLFENLQSKKIEPLLRRDTIDATSCGAIPFAQPTSFRLRD
jgi:hypothetical protein